MNVILVYLICLYLIAFVYDKAIDKVIKSNPDLSVKLTEFKYFHSIQSRPKALYSALNFKFLGFTPALNLIGSLFALTMYFGLIAGTYLLFQ